MAKICPCLTLQSFRHHAGSPETLFMSAQLVKVVCGGFAFIYFNVNFYGSLLNCYLFQVDFTTLSTSKI